MPALKRPTGNDGTSLKKKPSKSADSRASKIEESPPMGNETSVSKQEDTKNQVEASTWMEYFIGASEGELIKSKEKFLDVTNNLKNIQTNELWPMGTFEQPSVNELRRQMEAMQHDTTRDEVCPLNVIDSTDIGKYQAKQKTEDKVMVQIASNFNCLENGNPSTSADYGYLVTGYARDSTQGPAAAFGVPGASILRAHFPFKEEGRSSKEWGQCSTRQVNLIEDIAEWCGSCVNGKALLTGSEQPVTAETVDEVAGKIKVGLHSDCQVVFGRGSHRSRLKVVDSPPLVDQVCSATLCYGFVDKDVHFDLTNLARSCLRAAYEGAYMAAIKRERKVLLLTLIGGASFRNPLDVILDELVRAHKIWSTHPASQLREVRLVLFDAGVKDAFQKQLNKRLVG